MWCWVFGVMLNENTVGISPAVGQSECPFHTHTHTHTVTVEWTGRNATYEPMQDLPLKHIRERETHTHTFMLHSARYVLYVVWRDVWFGSQAGSWFRVTRRCRNTTATCHFCSYSNFCLMDCNYQANIVVLCVRLCLKQKLWGTSRPLSSRPKAKAGSPTRQDSPQKPFFHSI